MDKFELIEKLKQVDEVTLLELLEINATELVDTFLDKIEDRLDYLYGQIE
jgi:hypothetical protein